ncbi:hypothetical protein CEXT_547381 [Caerostris extrusa]|uniref:Uncharacterized protein n=1 Tax=Caerostris extrusa TaxID=172846 RepID=A0AAV4WD90_CAEEX|nr:hypothetical protein CEXT_547381 [Caerostris extrusa]
MNAIIHTPRSPNTPLHQACLYDNVECAQMLIKHEAYIDAIIQNKVSPLHDTCYQGSTACAIFLLKMGLMFIPLKMGEHHYMKHVCRTEWNVQQSYYLHMEQI